MLIYTYKYGDVCQWVWWEGISHCVVLFSSYSCIIDRSMETCKILTIRKQYYYSISWCGLKLFPVFESWGYWMYWQRRNMDKSTQFSCNYDVHICGCKLHSKSLKCSVLWLGLLVVQGFLFVAVHVSTPAVKCCGLFCLYPKM